ncbi:hypothetical protein HPB49_014022 [Dermacentor silvarum]|uniref:Uncharacterized protein n=1 Tax=Dermacentor silvarum TaxID=543639 RepID=A0ACB8C401_DERSI|nr:hypothetical protein HPB49_014022 [Dermacentor silvarum]
MLELADQFLEAQGGTNLSKIKKVEPEDAKKPASDERRNPQMPVPRPSTKDPVVAAIKSLLQEIARTTRVELFHVSGHSGLFGNELADFLASRAASIGTERVAAIPIKAVQAAFRKEQWTQ